MLKKLFDYNKNEIVTISDYYNHSKENKIYMYHLILLIFLYIAVLLGQYANRKFNIFTSGIILIAYIFLEYVNILVWRKDICRCRKYKNKDNDNDKEQ